MRPDFVFTDSERDQLYEGFLHAPVSPYDDYPSFLEWLRRLVGAHRDDWRYAAFCDELKERDWAENPIILVRNCPIDRELPVFDNADPVASKHASKRTFATEAFLTCHAILSGTETFAYASVNGGDFFHDIYPKESMFDSQSQKTLKTLRFHRDFSSHLVSPDFVNTIVLRDTPKNAVYSTYAVNRDVIRGLDEATLDVLREERFRTPFDDISRHSGDTHGVAPNHAVVGGDSDVRVYEGRTVGLDAEAQEALARSVQALHDHKIVYVPRPGEMVAFSNDHLIHGREVHEIHDMDSMRQRWLMKTHTLYSLEPFEDHLLPDRYGVVNG